MHTSPLRGIALATLTIATGCPLPFSAEAPPSTTAGSQVQLTMKLFAEDFGGGSDEPIACAELPNGWVVNSVGYEASTTGAGFDLNGTGTFNQSDTDSLGNQGRQGYAWHCYRGPTASYGNNAWGMATFEIVAQTNGEFTLATIASSANFGLTESPRIARHILVGGLHDPSHDWQTVGPPRSGRLLQVAYGSGRFVAVGERGLIRTSTDSFHWVPTSTDPIDLSDVIYARNEYWIVGQDQRVVRTLDGVALTRVHEGQRNEYLTAIAHGAGRFVAIAGQQSLVSTDGTNWAFHDMNVGNFMEAVAFDGTQFVSVGSSGTVATSTDGATWHRGSVGDTDFLRAVGYGNGRYTAAGHGSVYTSTNAVDWDEAVPPWQAIADIEFINDVWWAVGDAGLVMTSTDGLTWNRRGIGAGPPINGITHGEEQTVIVGHQQLLMRSGIPHALPAPSSVDLGTAAPGATTSAELLRIDNVGTGILALGTAMLTGPEFNISMAGCDNARLAVGQYCEIGVVMTPNSDGMKSGSISIATNDPDAPTVSFTLTGLAVTPQPSITLSPASVDLGMVSIGMSSATRTFDIGNSGDADLTFTSVGPLADPFGIVVDGCTGMSVAPMGNCTLEVQFTPTAEGYTESTFQIVSNDPLRATVTASVSGTGTPQPVPDIQVAGDLDFGPETVEVGDSVAAQVRITNMGNAPLDVGSIGGNDGLDPPFSMTGDTCSQATLAPTMTCNLTLSFAPTEARVFMDAFDIPSNDPDSPVVTATVTGTGRDPPPPMMGAPVIAATDSIAPADDGRLDFPQLVIGNAATATITVRNTGDAALSVDRAAWTNPDSAPFHILRDGCAGAAVDPAASCQIVVRFSPVVIGSFTNIVVIRSNDMATPRVEIIVGGSSKKDDPPPMMMSGNKPPEPPVLLKPQDGATGVEIPNKFRWEPVEDPDGDTVTYELVYCTNEDFVDCDPVMVSMLALLGTTYAQATFGGLTLFGLLLLAFGGPRKKACVTLISTSVLALALGACGAPRFEEFEVKDLEPGQTYYWRVVAKDGNGGESKSITWTFETKE